MNDKKPVEAEIVWDDFESPDGPGEPIKVSKPRTNKIKVPAHWQGERPLES